MDGVSELENVQSVEDADGASDFLFLSREGVGIKVWNAASLILI
jgi:hypothetical protein